MVEEDKVSEQRTVIVPDTHGCWEELQELMDVAQVTSSTRVIGLGDMCDRGPNSREVIEFFMGHEAVMGNHDERQVRYFDEWVRKGRPADLAGMHFKADYHRTTFSSLDGRHFEWMRSLPKFMRLPDQIGPDGNPVTLVHAGCLPEVPLEDQTDLILMHVSDIMPPFTGLHPELGIQHGYWKAECQTWWTSKAPPGATFWANLYDGSNGFVLFGHSGFLDVAKFDHSWGLDLGVPFGRRLCALLLPEWRIVSVPSRRQYVVNSKARLYEVSPGIQVYS